MNDPRFHRTKRVAMPAPSHRRGLIVAALAMLSWPLWWVSAGPTHNEEVLEAMRRASHFMMSDVSNRGGFLSLYTADLGEQWGELPARKSMIWVQDPGTVSVARMHLDAFKATGDEAYLDYAKRGADALIWGQHPSGGWHYFIDFDPGGVPEWYEQVASKCWGWEEFYHYHGNCTFDDNVTVGAAEFLLELYTTTKGPAYREPLLKALGFILDAQYPSGGWPQRYPPAPAHPPEGKPDYTSFYTFNDDVITSNIYFLLKAHERLGNGEYRDAAIRGMNFVAAAQLAPPQAGWAQQYDLDMNPRGARSCEPRGLSPPITASSIHHLMSFYRITGDRRYLKGIPDALTWLDEAVLPPGHSDEGHTHAFFVEMGTNRPLYAHREGATMSTGRYWTDYEPVNILPGYGYRVRMNPSWFRAEYERVSALSPEAALAEYRAKRDAAPPAPHVSWESVRAVIDALDERGAWVEDLSLLDYGNYIENPKREFRGISTKSYVDNMHVLIAHMRMSNNPERL